MTTEPVPAAAPARETGPDLAAVRARCDAATPGPWTTNEQGWTWHWMINVPDSVAIEAAGWRYEVPLIPRGTVHTADAEFIAHARTDLPALLDLAERQQQEIQRLTAENDELAARIAAVEKLIDPESAMASVSWTNRRHFYEEDIRAALRGDSGEASNAS